MKRLDVFSLAGLFCPVHTNWGFRSMFGTPPVVVDVLLELLLSLQLPCLKFCSSSLFMTLNFLKDPASSWFNFGCCWRLDGRTAKKILINTLKLIDFVLPEVFRLFFFSFLFFSN
jgi:hypothetical protein